MWQSKFLNQVLTKADKLSQEEIKRIIHNLDKHQQTLASIFNSLPFGMVLVNPSYLTQYMNKIAISMFGFQEIYWQNRSLFSLLEGENLKTQIKLALNNTSNQYLCTVRIKETQYNIKVHPFVQEGLIRGNLIIMQGEPPDKQKKQLHEQSQRLKSLSQLLANIAHEIKNPLTALDIHIQLIKQEISDNASIQPNLDILNEEVGRLNKIIQNFLSSLRPMKIKRRDIFLLDMLKNSILVLEPEFKKKHVHFKLDAINNPLVHLDGNYIQQVLLNLLKNSLDACKPRDNITLRSRVYDHNLEIDVEDSGSGIVEELKSQIFDPYFTTKKTGSGIGLTIVHQIIQEHQCQIDIQSNPNNGTQVRLLFPNAISKSKTLLNSPNNSSPRYE